MKQLRWTLFWSIVNLLIACTTLIIFITGASLYYLEAWKDAATCFFLCACLCVTKINLSACDSDQ